MLLHLAKLLWSSAVVASRFNASCVLRCSLAYLVILSHYYLTVSTTQCNCVLFDCSQQGILLSRCIDVFMKSVMFLLGKVAVTFVIVHTSDVIISFGLNVTVIVDRKLFRFMAVSVHLRIKLYYSGNYSY